MRRAGCCGLSRSEAEVAATPPAQIEIPVCVADEVLFPGASLELRLVEPHDLGLLRDGSRAGAPFGVCLRGDGERVPHEVGTLAQVSDFWTRSDGALGVRVRGGERFRARAFRWRDDGQRAAEVELWASEPAVVLPPTHGLLALILERLLERMGGNWATAPRECLEDASWVGMRLAELLPFAAVERQRLLACEEPLARLDLLLEWLPRFQPE